MADRTKIEWADSTWNPVVGCEKVSPGCAHCYAESFARRQGVSYSYEPGKATIRCFPERLEIPLHWRKPRRVFVCSLSDLFHEQVPDEFIGRVFGMMAEAHWHTFMVLTKRADRMEEWSRGVAHYPRGDTSERPVPGWPPNVEAGVSIENEYWKEKRLPHLLATPARRRFVSYEPALGAIDLTPFFEPTYGCDMPSHVLSGRHGLRLPPIDQVICGGESGPRARPMHPDWPRGVRDQCVAAGVNFMFKQWGEWIPQSQEPLSWPNTSIKVHGWPDGSLSYRVGKKAAGAVLDGRQWLMEGLTMATQGAQAAGRSAI